VDNISAINCVILIFLFSFFISKKKTGIYFAEEFFADKGQYRKTFSAVIS